MKVAARIFASRKVWVAIGGLLACLVVVLGLDPAKWTPMISAIVGLAGVVIAATGYEDGQQKSGANPAPVISPVNSGGPPLTGVALALAMGALMLGGVGCARIKAGQDPLLVNGQRSVQSAFDTTDAALTFEKTNRAIIVANAPAVHTLAEETRVRAPGIFKSAWDALAAYQANSTTANASTLNTAIGVAESLAADVRKWLITAQATVNPVAKPAGS